MVCRRGLRGRHWHWSLLRHVARVESGASRPHRGLALRIRKKRSVASAPSDATRDAHTRRGPAARCGLARGHGAARTALPEGTGGAGAWPLTGEPFNEKPARASRATLAWRPDNAGQPHLWHHLPSHANCGRHHPTPGLCNPGGRFESRRPELPWRSFPPVSGDPARRTRTAPARVTHVARARDRRSSRAGISAQRCPAGQAWTVPEGDRTTDPAEI